MKYNIVFSIPIHEKFEVVIDQIINIFSQNANCAIIFHISKGFNYSDSLISRDEFIQITKKIGDIYINPQSVRTGYGDIIQAHLSNFSYVYNHFNFEYIAFLSSNEMFIKKGLFDHICNYDCGIQFIDVSEKKHANWTTGLSSTIDKELKKYLATNNCDKIYGSHIEGSFFKKDLFLTIVHEINGFYNYLEMQYAYPREEIYFSSVLNCLLQKEIPIKVLNNGLFSWSRWLDFMNLKVWSWDVIRFQSNPRVFSVKRVDRSLNNNLRIFLRQYLHYSSAIFMHLQGLEVKKKKTIVIFIVDTIDYLKTFLLIPLRKIRSYFLFLKDYKEKK